MTRLRHLMLASMLAVTSVACGTTATIRSRDGSEYELEILRSTPGELIVATRQGARAIPREQIRDIDHPGNVLATAGIVLLLIGTVTLLGDHQCDARSDFCVGWAGAAGFATIGLTMTAIGGWTWTHSVHAASGHDLAAPASNF